MDRVVESSLEIFFAIKEDLNPDLFKRIEIKDTPETTNEIIQESNDLIFFNLNLNLYEKPEEELKKALYSLRPGGIILANCFGGNSYQELIESLVRVDLEDNFFMERFLPRIQPSGLMALGKAIGVKSPLVMENNFTYLYPSFEDFIKEKSASNYIIQGRRKPLWEKVGEYYKENFSLDNQIKVTVTLLSLFIVKN